MAISPPEISTLPAAPPAGPTHSTAAMLPWPRWSPNHGCRSHAAMAGTPDARQARFYPMCMSPPPPGQLLSDHLQLLLVGPRSPLAGYPQVMIKAIPGQEIMPNIQGS
ncbi:hypothetical protein E2562_026738 [Oryza meyeriana var. granulata]|uniref:Uncharacterized protein n=1 Tax=Oryza meyeriana var. granulata TaxID=110450 RepID=A0A6G1CAH7_9ORYZ|nr:hypothetical protein E2562_026738 [Oryza meyeriana var. granulata]